jgi:hypothetical protein
MKAMFILIYLFTYLLTYAIVQGIIWKTDCHSVCQKIGGSLVTTAWRILRLRMGGRPPDKEGSCKYKGASKSFRTESIKKYNAYLWYYLLRSNTKGYGGKTHQTDSQNSDTTTPSGRELYHLRFSLQIPSPETFGYTLVYE